MALHPSKKPFTPFIHPTEVAAQELSKTRGSLSAVANGHVQKMGHTDAWDMGKEWVGRELVRYTYRESLWDKSIRVVFDWKTGAGAFMPVFTLSLHPPLTKEEIERSAETHMMLLNLTRKEM